MRDYNELIDSVLVEWSSKSSAGIPSYDDDGLAFLLESLIESGLSKEDAFEIAKVISEKGKYPQRQAYNKNGLLVTFPTPEYKARAIAKGTHFEKNPKVAQSNLFGGGQQAPNSASPTAPPSAGTDDQGSSTLPPSDGAQPEPSAEEPPADSPAPLAGGGGGGGGTTPPAQGQLAVEPTPQIPTQSANVAPVPQPKPVPVVQKTPEEIAAEKEVIKQFLNVGDTIPTVSPIGIAESLKHELQKLSKVGLELELNSAVRFLVKHISKL